MRHHTTENVTLDYREHQLHSGESNIFENDSGQPQYSQLRKPPTKEQITDQTPDSVGHQQSTRNCWNQLISKRNHFFMQAFCRQTSWQKNRNSLVKDLSLAFEHPLMVHFVDFLFRSDPTIPLSTVSETNFALNDDLVSSFLPLCQQTIEQRSINLRIAKRNGFTREKK